MSSPLIWERERERFRATRSNYARNLTKKNQGTSPKQKTETSQGIRQRFVAYLQSFSFQSRLTNHLSVS
jgi:hypothetical protein